MAVKLSQGLRQTQNLAMTPQLQQAIKLLTLTHLEMADMISSEMAENPMLEEFDGDEARSNEEIQTDEKLAAATKETDSTQFEGERLVEKDDFDWSSYAESFNSSSHSAPSMKESLDSEDTFNYENVISRGIDLTEHLEFQIRMGDLSSKEQQVADFLIHNLDGTGMIDGDYQEIVLKSGFEKNLVEEVRQYIQTLDPVGCGSINLIDCLLAQARSMEERSPLLEKMIRQHLPDLQKKDYAKISKATGATLEQVKNCELIIQGLNPRPGRLVCSEDTQYVAPDIYVVEVAGEFVVAVNEEGVPRLRISKLYQKLLAKGGDPKAREYVQEKLKAATWLIKSIQNRQKTIVKVAKAIVRRQQDFFKKGPKCLRPMILKDIADEIGMHESTVSRVTSNKYMHTPIGLYELKYFFSSGIGAEGGHEISGEVLKIKIKSLIEAENPKRPLSDQKIVELLDREDIQVARRTVAKYREMLGIDSSARRKRAQ